MAAPDALVDFHTGEYPTTNCESGTGAQKYSTSSSTTMTPSRTPPRGRSWRAVMARRPATWPTIFARTPSTKAAGSPWYVSRDSMSGNTGDAVRCDGGVSRGWTMASPSMSIMNA